jgi:hypothetical protein
MPSKLNAQILAKYSNIAYTENFEKMKSEANNLVKDWKLVGSSVETHQAYDMMYHSFAVANSQLKQILVVNAGTRINYSNTLNNPGFISDMFSNLFVWGKNTPLAFLDDGVKFIDSLLPKYAGYHFVNTGHSLGSVYAQLSHAYLASKGIKKVSSVVFESPGASEVVSDFLTNHLNVAGTNKVLLHVKEHSEIYNVEDSSIGGYINRHLGDLYIVADREYISATDLARIDGNGAKKSTNILKAIDLIFNGSVKHSLDYLIPRLAPDKMELAPCITDEPQSILNLVEGVVTEVGQIFGE